ncbi:2-amino-4-hydroxy-6-hydroxymethyldihydropteridine diphosphokinase [Marinobacter salinus]|uniref:2-amino-4-hydroxy-6-hydroxymethyldihydropteridine diphosphokinase n=1 Tax=Marinobacter salinus TaxID=1874317 RepID=A0A1D9GMV4_9GAMM|nr:2-amino-4-hydroxy-6-hydroxymethyldihydropteridine diphosphokinase [Marinobacter salinus]AOY88962.1 2-amino-4-hydroxy-6-hydroxymethyldihydropteridine diphosphokinase [Marinobacter salinus]
MAGRVKVYLSIGSNVDRERYVSAALDALGEWFGELEISPVYESEAVGFDGSPFLNLVVGVTTDASVGELSRRFKRLEAENGRRRNVPKFSARTLDLDILTYGDAIGQIDGVELPRGEILKNAFVLRPLADIAPEVLHPVCGQSYGELWQEYSADQRLWPVNFRWQGRQISLSAG